MCMSDDWYKCERFMFCCSDNEIFAFIHLLIHSNMWSALCRQCRVRVVVVVVVRRAYTRRHNYRVTSAPPSRLSVSKQKCLQWSTVFAKLTVWPSQFRRQVVPDPGAGSGKTPVVKTGTCPRDDARFHVGRTCWRQSAGGQLLAK